MKYIQYDPAEFDKITVNPNADKQKIEKLRARIAELEADNAKLKECREMLGEQLQKEIMQTISLQAELRRAAANTGDR